MARSDPADVQGAYETGVRVAEFSGAPDAGLDASVSADGLVAFYPCDGISDTQITDRSGNDNHAVCTACPGRDLGGPRESFCTYDGTQSALLSGSAFEPNAFTIALWARPDASADSLSHLVGRGFAYGRENSFEIFYCDRPAFSGVEDGSWGVRAVMTDSRVVQRGVNQPLDDPQAWHHFALVNNGDSMTL